ncbi:MAG: hypothetical protein U0169_13345 [Polyangiaceae bacterium]
MNRIAVAPRARVTPDEEWFVTDGRTVVGPVSFELLRRGLENGKVPHSSRFRRASDPTFRTLEETPELSPDASGIRMSPATGFAAADPFVEDGLLARDLRAIQDAPSLRSAAFETLVAAVSHLRCDVGLVALRDRFDNFVVSSGHGANAPTFLGRNVLRSDHTLLALQKTDVLWGDGFTGPARRQTTARLGALDTTPTDVLAMALVGEHGLFGFVELGSPKVGRRGFDASHVTLLACLVDELAHVVATRRFLETPSVP